MYTFANLLSIGIVSTVWTRVVLNVSKYQKHKGLFKISSGLLLGMLMTVLVCLVLNPSSSVIMAFSNILWVFIVLFPLIQFIAYMKYKHMMKRLNKK